MSDERVNTESEAESPDGEVRRDGLAAMLILVLTVVFIVVVLVALLA